MKKFFKKKKLTLVNHPFLPTRIKLVDETLQISTIDLVFADSHMIKRILKHSVLYNRDTPHTDHRPLVTYIQSHIECNLTKESFSLENFLTEIDLIEADGNRNLS